MRLELTCAACIYVSGVILWDKLYLHAEVSNKCTPNSYIAAAVLVVLVFVSYLLDNRG
jgi:hypothetical protein